MQLVLNLKSPNKFIYPRHFKMEGMHTVRDLLQRGWQESTSKMHNLQFEVSEVSLERKMLSLYMPSIRTGVCPKGFYKVLGSVVGFLRSRSMHCVVYINDLLLMHQDKKKLREFSVTVLVVLKSLDFFDKLSQVRAWTNSKFGTPGIYNVEKESSLTAEKRRL